VLPASPEPPENSGDKCVVVLIDKSSSMEGEKIRMARQSVLAIADTLSSQDTVGVLAFDHSFQWVVPIQKFQDRRVFLQKVSNLTADGGTEIPPALSAAYHAALISKAKYRHLVLVTDGISEEGDSVQLATEASRQGIAISTVGIGAAVNRSFLEAVARASGGRSYFLATAEDLKKITLKDVRDYTGSNSVDRPFRPIVRQRRDILDGVDMLKAPSLMRYTRYTAKPGAEDILGIGEGGKDPLYVRWQYGLGRVGLFTSGAIGEWGGSWKEPEQFDRLWANLARDLYSHTKTSEVVATAPPGQAGITIKYSLGPKALPGLALPTIRVLGPNGFNKPVALQETSPFSYTAQVSIGDQSGVFRILPEPPSTEFPPTALLAQQEGEAASGREALQQIAEQTGGSFYTGPAPNHVWKARPSPRSVDLWPALVGLAITLNIVELALRRKRLGLRKLLRPRPQETFSTIES
jgi:Ca-activated chloride channel homolog